MRILVRVAFALIAIVCLASAPVAATLDLAGAAGASIAQGSADTAVYSGNAAFGSVTVSAHPKGSDLTHVAGSGLGIDCDGGRVACAVDKATQLDNGEVLKISFEKPLLVTSLDIRNLYGTDIGRGFLSIHIDEGGAVLGSGFSVAFRSDDAGADGALTLDINHWASAISIVPNGSFFTAFSLAGITIAEASPGPITPPPSTPIPEPSSVLLMIVGAAIVALQVRKRL
jgi:hypothetical protein